MTPTTFVGARVKAYAAIVALGGSGPAWWSDGNPYDEGLSGHLHVPKPRHRGFASSQ